MSGFARTVGCIAAGIRIAARTGLPVDTNPVPADWEHVTKVDPEPGKRLPLAYPLYLGHTDAVSVGGSRDVTAENTEATFELLSYAPAPAFHEPSGATHVTSATRDRAAFVAIPEVLNGDVESIIGELGAGLEHVRDEVAPEEIAENYPWLPQGVKDAMAEFAASWMMADANFEAYVIQNPDSAAAREAGVDPEDVLGPEEAGRRAMAAERRLGSEVIYVEYSGTYGGEEGQRTVEAVDDATNWSRLWYGGGIDSRAAATEMLSAGADAVIVGDAFHEVAEEEADLGERALSALGAGTDRETVREWVHEQVDPDQTRAARYLSTIPDVPDPDERAADYLAEGVATRLGIEALVERAGDASTADDLRSLLRAAGVPGEARMADQIGKRGKAYAQASALSVLADRVGIEADPLPGDHLAVRSRATEEAS